ncbi:MAG TPA: hypothetical protein VG826_28995 [Pirellulales bacterium]|nr:hypothetical protein [Pirellulales bacterium]
MLLFVAVVADNVGAQIRPRQPERPAVPGLLINDVAPPPPGNAEPIDDVFAREVWFMAQVGDLSPDEADSLTHEARKTQARWGARLDDAALAASLRRELTPLLKDVSRSGWEKFDTERQKLADRRRHASIVRQVAELDEAIVLTGDERAHLCERLAKAANVYLGPPWEPAPPPAPMSRLPAAISAGDLEEFGLPDPLLAAALWPAQFVAYKNLMSSPQRRVVAIEQNGGLVIERHGLPLDEQQRRLMIYLDRLIDTADTICRLNDSQREKLRLAGKIDIDRFGERYREVESLAGGDPVEKEAQLSVLQSAGHRVLGERASNYRKAVAALLTAEQMERLTVAESERREFRRRALVEAVVVGFGRSASLTAAQCDLLAQTFNDALSAGDAVDQPAGECLRMVGELPEEKLRSICAREQWPAFRRQLALLSRIASQLEAEAAGKIAVLRGIRITGAVNGENVDVELDEIRLNVD